MCLEFISYKDRKPALIRTKAMCCYLVWTISIYLQKCLNSRKSTSRTGHCLLTALLQIPWEHSCSSKQEDITCIHVIQHNPILAFNHSHFMRTFSLLRSNSLLHCFGLLKSCLKCFPMWQIFPSLFIHTSSTQKVSYKCFKLLKSAIFTISAVHNVCTIWHLL